MVEVTVNGAVPVATLLVNVLATTLFVALKLLAFAFAVTANDDSVPTDVILACALVVTEPAVVAESAVPAVAAFRFATCVVEVTINGAVPVATFDVNVLAVTVPVTPSDDNVPVEVIFGCAAVVKVPVK